MRTATGETAPQIALRNCSKDVREDSICVILLKGGVRAIKHVFFCRKFLLVS